MIKSNQISANNITDINDVVIGFDIQSENDYQSKTHEVDLMMRHDFDYLEVGVDVEVSFNLDYPLYGATNQNNSEQKIYFFHKDHLGSSTQISDISANIIHHIEYMPYGESFVEQRSNWGTNYKFNGKELDEETGFYYYGARYYNPDISIFLSIDRFSDKYPTLSPYHYCANNPIKYIDVNGDSTIYYSESGRHLFTSHDKMQNALVIIKDKDVQNFVKTGTEFLKAGQADTDNANIVGRMMGTEYMLDDFYDWLDNEVDGEWLSNSSGERTGWRAEKGSMLFDDNGRIRIGSKVGVGDHDRIFWNQDYGEVDQGSVSKVHSHSNVGLTSYKTYYSGRSYADSKSHNTPTNYMDVIVEINQNREKKLIFYNGPAGYGGTNIRIDKNTFKNTR